MYGGSVAALASCGESEQPAVIDILTPAAAPQGQNLLDCPNPNVYDQWVGRWEEAYSVDDTEASLIELRDETNRFQGYQVSVITVEPNWEYVFHANGTFEKISTHEPKNVAEEHLSKQSGFFAVGKTEFYIGIRNPSEWRTDWDGTWLRSQDYLILGTRNVHPSSRRERIGYYTVLRKM